MPMDAWLDDWDFMRNDTEAFGCCMLTIPWRQLTLVTVNGTLRLNGVA